MKRARSILIIGALILGIIGLAACGNQDGAKTQVSAEPQPAKPPSGSTGNWGIPIYPGSEEGEYYVKAEEGQFLNGKPAVLESRLYAASDKVDTVVAFYKQKMAASGWKDKGWIEAEPMSLGQYEKDGGQDTAVVQIYVESNATNIKIDRIYAK